MKKFFLFALAFAFVGLTGCTEETNTEVTDGTAADTAMVDDMGMTDPMMGADTTGMGAMGADTTGMGTMGADTMGADTMGTGTTGTGTMMGDSAAAAPAGQ